MDARGVYKVCGVDPVVKLDLSISLQDGKSVKVRPDTSAAYNMWFDKLSALANPKVMANKQGFVMYQDEEETWNRFYMAVKGDNMSLYEDEHMVELKVSGIIRTVADWQEEHMLGLVIRLNMKRTIRLRCDSIEEKNAWQLYFDYTKVQEPENDNSVWL